MAIKVLNATSSLSSSSDESGTPSSKYESAGGQSNEFSESGLLIKSSSVLIWLKFSKNFSSDSRHCSRNL